MKSPVTVGIGQVKLSAKTVVTFANEHEYRLTLKANPNCIGSESQLFAMLVVRLIISA